MTKFGRHVFPEEGLLHLNRVAGGFLKTPEAAVGLVEHGAHDALGGEGGFSGAVAAEDQELAVFVEDLVGAAPGFGFPFVAERVVLLIGNLLFADAPEVGELVGGEAPGAVFEAGQHVAGGIAAEQRGGFVDGVGGEEHQSDE